MEQQDEWKHVPEPTNLPTHLTILATLRSSAVGMFSNFGHHKTCLKDTHIPEQTSFKTHMFLLNLSIVHDSMATTRRCPRGIFPILQHPQKCARDAQKQQQDRYNSQEICTGRPMGSTGETNLQGHCTASFRVPSNGRKRLPKKVIPDCSIDDGLYTV